MLGFIKNTLQSIAQKTTHIDDKFYAQVIDELSNGFKDKSALGKAIAKAQGDSKLAESLYVEIRALDLQIEQNMKEKAKQTEQKLQERARLSQLETIKNLKKEIQKNYENNFYNEKFQSILQQHGFSIMTNYRYVKLNEQYFETSIDYDLYKLNIHDFSTKEIVFSVDLGSLAD